MAIEGFPLDSVVYGIGEDGLPDYSRKYNSRQYREFIGTLVSDGVIASSGDEPLKVSIGDFPFDGSPAFNINVNDGKAIVDGAFAIVNDYQTTVSEAASSSSTKKAKKTYICLELRKKTQYQREEYVWLMPIAGEAVDYPSEPPEPVISSDRTVLVLAVIRSVSHIDTVSGKTIYDELEIEDTRSDESLCGFAAPFADVDLTSVNEKIDEAIQKLGEETDKAVELAQNALDGTTAGALNSKIDQLAERVTPIPKGGTGTSSVFDAAQKLQTVSLLNGTKLVDGFDFNDLGTPLTYTITQSAAESCENKPVDDLGAARLIVFRPTMVGSGAALKVGQFLLENDTGRAWTRYTMNNENGTIVGWQPWNHYIQQGEAGVIDAGMLGDGLTQKLSILDRTTMNANMSIEIKAANTEQGRPMFVTNLNGKVCDIAIVPDGIQVRINGTVLGIAKWG